MKFYAVLEDDVVVGVFNTKRTAVHAAEEIFGDAVSEDYDSTVSVIKYDIPVNASRIKALLMGSGYSNNTETVWIGDTRDYS
jgi:hypothetical protein